MNRIVSLVAVLAVVLALASTAQAGKKKKKAPLGIAGTVTAVSPDGKTLTLSLLGAKKKKKAQPAEVKLTERTRVEYIGFRDGDEKKLAVGQVVIVGLDESAPGTARVVAVGKVKVKAKKKKKNNP